MGLTDHFTSYSLAVARLWDANHLLIGHGLSKDLHAIGLAKTLLLRPEGAFDTMTFPKFQGKGGNARPLKRLAKELLGLEIQPHGRRHDPEVDAHAVLRLFMEHARPRLLSSASSYDELVSHYQKEILFYHKNQIQQDLDSTPL